LDVEIEGLLQEWEKTIGDAPYYPVNERMAKIDFTPELLRRWFRDAMLQPFTYSRLAARVSG